MDDAYPLFSSVFIDFSSKEHKHGEELAWLEIG